MDFFDTHVDPFKEKNVGTLTVFSDFYLFWAEKTHFHTERHENKEKRLFYFDLRILLPILIKK
jgi:hypothetical protein